MDEHQNAGYIDEKAGNDEIKLIDLCLVLWKRKLFILLATVLPTLCLAGALILGPQKYQTTYVFDVNDWQLNEKKLHLLYGQFYSKESLTRIAQKLKPYISSLKDQPAFEGRNLEKRIQLQETGRSSLHLTVTDNSIENARSLGTIACNTITDFALLPIIQEEMYSTLKELNRLLADFERNRFDLQLNLNYTAETLQALKKLSVSTPAASHENITLQLDHNEQQLYYLPLSYQIQAAESKRIELEETIKINNEKYNYYKDLVDLNNKVLLELNTKLSSDYTTDQFLAFLTGLLSSTEKPQLKDYLSSYARTIENKISASKSVSERSKIISLNQGIAKKLSFVFSACLALSMLISFWMAVAVRNKTRD